VITVASHVQGAAFLVIALFAISDWGAWAEELRRWARDGRCAWFQEAGALLVS
jgi:hypothetical protein